MYYSRVVLGWIYGAPEVKVMLILVRLLPLLLGGADVCTYSTLEGEQTRENNSR